jgi:hypothetical protein
MARINATINDTLLESIKSISDKEKRSVSSMVEILLEQSVKERNRKKKKNDVNDERLK